MKGLSLRKQPSAVGSAVCGKRYCMQIAHVSGKRGRSPHGSLQNSTLPLRYALCMALRAHTLVHESHTHGRSAGHVILAIKQQQWHGKQHKMLNKKSCFCLKPRTASRSMI